MRYGMVIDLKKCVGCMAWESPFVVFGRANGEKITWHSDGIDSVLSDNGLRHRNLDNGNQCAVSMNYREVKGKLRVYRLHSIKKV